jgi:hypothetical protein
MKKISALLLCVLTTAVFFVGCQPTPEKPIVGQKDMEQMIEKAQKASETDHTNGRSLRERLDAPEILTAEISSAKGKLKVHVNADVVIPDVSGIPVTRVGMGIFTQDDVERLHATLIGDALPVALNNTEETQALRMRSIQGLLEQKKTGSLDKYASMKALDAAIQKATQEASQLPKHFKRVEPDFSFHPMEDGGSKAHLRAAPDDATVSDLSLYNAQQGQGQSHMEYYRDLYQIAALSSLLNSGKFMPVQTEGPSFQPPSMSEDAARKLAQDTIAALGLTDFVCSGHRINALNNSGVEAEDAPRKGIYEYMFTRQIAGIPVTYTNDDGNAMPDEAKDPTDIYAAPWLYEKVRILIDDSGVLCLIWNSPYIVKDTVTSDSAMLSFDQIQNTFEKMIPVVYNFYDSSKQDMTCDMYVTQVRLGLMRITEKDIGTSGLLIPVWDFIGYSEDSQNNGYGKDGYNVLLTINAIDGTVVDRGLGY